MIDLGKKDNNANSWQSQIVDTDMLCYYHQERVVGFTDAQIQYVENHTGFYAIAQDLLLNGTLWILRSDALMRAGR